MSATTSASRRRYGIHRVCRVSRVRPSSDVQGERAARRGAAARSDQQLLAAIRADLARSPFQGEGHRKVHARLRILAGIASPAPVCCA